MTKEDTMDSENLFESFRERSYTGTTDPFISITEGPRTTWEATHAEHDINPTVDEEDPFETYTGPEEAFEPSDLEKEADRLLASARGEAVEDGEFTDAMDFASPLAGGEAITNPEYNLNGGFEIKSDIEDGEALLGEEEPKEFSSPNKAIEQGDPLLASISDKDLAAEVTRRMTMENDSIDNPYSYDLPENN